MNTVGGSSDSVETHLTLSSAYFTSEKVFFGDPTQEVTGSFWIPSAHILFDKINKLSDTNVSFHLDIIFVTTYFSLR